MCSKLLRQMPVNVHDHLHLFVGQFKFLTNRKSLHTCDSSFFHGHPFKNKASIISCVWAKTQFHFEYILYNCPVWRSLSFSLYVCLSYKTYFMFSFSTKVINKMKFSSIIRIATVICFIYLAFYFNSLNIFGVCGFGLTILFSSPPLSISFYQNNLVKFYRNQCYTVHGFQCTCTRKETNFKVFPTNHILLSYYVLSALKCKLD